MKLHLPIIALSLYSVLAVDDNGTNKASFKKTAGNSIRGTKDAGRKLQDDEICLPTYTFETEKGCTTNGIDAFTVDLEAALSDVGCTHDATEELRLVLGVDTDDEVYDFFWDTCFEFWSSQEGRNFAEIGDGTDLFIKAFFDGAFSKSASCSISLQMIFTNTF
jgi:hypothetical protein